VSDDDDDRLDLSPLDPARDPRRWESLVARTTARALAGRAAPPPTLRAELARYSVPLVAAALLVCASALALAQRTSTSSASDGLSADAFSEWANQGDIPAGVDLVTSLPGAAR
jgi:hypothetical protein